jgi:hypothetical protein
MNDKIFVSIAAFNEEILDYTVNTCLGNAYNSDRINIGIVSNCNEEFSFPYLDDIPNVKILRLPDTESEGCGKARKLVQDFYDNETYHCQIDSHMHFVENWDKEYIEMLHRMPSDKPLLVCFGNAFSFTKDKEVLLQDTVPHEMYSTIYRYSKWVDMQTSRVHSPIFPNLTPFFCAGNIFTYGEWIKEVPYDPDFYYTGEEPTMGIRSYTTGWDSFIPDKMLIYHFDYSQYSTGRRLRPQDVIGDEKAHEYGDTGYKKLLKICYEPYDPGLSCGLGNVRTLEEWERFANVSFKKKIIGFQKIDIIMNISNIDISIETLKDILLQGQYPQNFRFKFILNDDVYKNLFIKEVKKLFEYVVEEYYIRNIKVVKKLGTPPADDKILWNETEFDERVSFDINKMDSDYKITIKENDRMYYLWDSVYMRDCNHKQYTDEFRKRIIKSV